MDLTRIAYNGRKIYRDKVSGNTWEPGAVKLVTPDAAKALLRFAEFALAKDTPADAKSPKDKAEELQKAQTLHEEQKRKAADEHQQTENMLLTVESMDKGALEEYARKYEVELDKRLGIAKLRAEVSTLIEQFGAR